MLENRNPCHNKRCGKFIQDTKFYQNQNRSSFVEDMAKTFWLPFLDTI